MAIKLINTDYEPGALEVANWILAEASELRQWRGDDELLMFVSHYDLQEFFDLLDEHTYEFWVDGVTELSYNGHDYIIDIHPILKQLGIDPQIVFKAYKDGGGE